MGLCELEVAPSPALLEGREESAKQAYDEAQEPEHVDPDGRSRRFPASRRLEEGRARRVTGKGPVRKLLGYLSEEDDSISRRVGQQRLVTIDDERGDCRREQTSLTKQVYHVSSPLVMTRRKTTYENEYSIGVRFPGIGLLSVVFLGMR